MGLSVQGGLLRRLDSAPFVGAFFRGLLEITAYEAPLEARLLLANGADPGEHKKQAKRAARVASANSFEAVAREGFPKFSSG